MASEVTWVNAVMTLVTVVGSSYALYNARRSARDRFEFEQDKADLKAENQRISNQLDLTKRELELAKTETEKCSKEREEDRVRRGAEREADKQEIQSLRDRVATLEGMILKYTTKGTR